MRKLILTAICGFACFTPAFASGLTASQTVQKEIVVKNEDLSIYLIQACSRQQTLSW